MKWNNNITFCSVTNLNSPRWYANTSLAPTAEMIGSESAAASKLWCAAVAPMTSRTRTTLRTPSVTLVETNFTDAASCDPGTSCPKLRSVTVPVTPSTMIAYVPAFIAVASKPMPNHALAGFLNVHI